MQQGGVLDIEKELFSFLPYWSSYCFIVNKTLSRTI